MQGETFDKLKNQKIKYTVVLDEKRQSILGVLAILLFIVLWLMTCTFPIVIIFGLYYSYYKFSFLYSLAFLCSYYPFPVFPFFKTHFGNCFNRYFKHTTLTYEDGTDILQKDKKTVAAIHPHGIFCLSWTVFYCTYEALKCTFCFSAFLNQGYWRLVSNLTGNPSNVDKKTMTQLMKNGKSVALIPGGFEEASFLEYGKEIVYLKSRAGFVRLALQFGYSLTPVYGFKECFSYYNVPGFKSIRKMLNKYSIPGIVIWGETFLPFLPKRECEIHVVVGKSIQIPQINNPTREEVQKYHSLYMQELESLFDRHKSRFYENSENLKLQFI